MTRAMSIGFYSAIAIFTVWLSMQVKDECYFLNKNSAGRKQNNIILMGIFTILFAVSAFRFNVGNDYENYVLTAHEVYVHGYVVTEIGFNWFVRFIYNLFGSECYELVFAAFAFATIGVFIKAMYEQADVFYESFFLFMTMGLYFQTFNTMRYYFVLALVVYSMRYVLKKDWLRFVLIILFASLFHKSVLIVLPVFFLVTLDWNKWVYIGIGVISAICYVLKGPMLKLALVLYPSYKNTMYLEGGTSILSIVRTLAILGFTIFIMATANVEEAKKDEIIIYTRLNYLSLIAYTFFSFLPVITRIGYYFSVFQLFLLPILIQQVKVERRAKLYKKIIITVSIVLFFMFLFTADKDGVSLLPYRSWLFEANRYHIK